MGTLWLYLHRCCFCSLFFRFLVFQLKRVMQKLKKAHKNRLVDTVSNNLEDCKITSFNSVNVSHIPSYLTIRQDTDISFYICVAFSVTTLQSDTMVLPDLLTPTDQPSTLGPSSGTVSSSKAEQNVDLKVTLSPLFLSEHFCCDRSSIHQSNVAGVRQACKFFLSLLCGLFNPTPSPAGDWLAETNQLKDSSTDQYLSSSALPELPLHVIGVPIPLAGTSARTCRAVWGPLTEVIQY